MQNNLAKTYQALGRHEEALRMKQDVYAGRVKLNGKEHEKTLIVANNLASSLISLQRLEEASSLMRKNIPVARRVLGDSHEFTLRIRWVYALALCRNDGATLGDLREAVETLESVELLYTRVFGASHPETPKIKKALREARQALATCTT